MSSNSKSRSAMSSEADRVLILTSVMEQPQIKKALAQSGIQSEVCSDASEMRRKMATGVAAVIASEEALQAELPQIIEALQPKPSGYEPSLIVLGGRKSDLPAVQQLAAELGNAASLTLLQRPVRALALSIAARTALRAHAQNDELRRFREKLGLAKRELRQRNRTRLQVRESSQAARRLQKLTMEQSESEDRERHRLSEILHDDLQQVLVAAKFHLAKLAFHIPDSSSKAVAAQIESMLGDAIQKSRTLAQELSPTVLHRANFAEVLRWLAGQIQAMHGLELQLDLSRELQIESNALRWLLYKSINELLLNLTRHARTHRVRIRARRVRNHICISLTDQGKRFSPGELDERAGLGLAGIRERLELLGGRLAIRSTQGNASSLRIVIPECPFSEEKPMPKPAPLTQDPEFSNLARLRVLIADDHEIVREGIASLLSEQKDVEVVAQAGNGREAVDLAGQFRPDVVIMDASMPLMNGDEATRQIKTHLPKTRVVALSMFDQNEMVQRMYRAGVESYVLKTAPPEDLLAAIRNKEQQSN